MGLQLAGVLLFMLVAGGSIYEMDLSVFYYFCHSKEAQRILDKVNFQIQADIYKLILSIRNMNFVVKI